MLKVAVIYGGMSTEHDVSLISGKNVIDNLDKSKYEIYEIKITKDGKWLDKRDREIKDIYKDFIDTFKECYELQDKDVKTGFIKELWQAILRLFAPLF